MTDQRNPHTVCWGLIALLSASLCLGWNIHAGLDQIIYRDWWRQNIHLFTPLLPALLSLVSALRREPLRWPLVTLLLLALHYLFLDFLVGLGRAAAGVWSQL